MNSAYRARRKIRVRGVWSQRRAANDARCVLQETRRHDRIRGLDFDLDRVFIETELAKGCQYCGAEFGEVHIGLDRINNDIGHLKSNVVPACSRCNLVRGDMPYEAWLQIAPSMRRTRELGLFGEWVPGNRKVPADRKVLEVRDVAQRQSTPFGAEGPRFQHSPSRPNSGRPTLEQLIEENRLADRRGEDR